MTDGAQVVGLAERCEAATGPDRGLDALPPRIVRRLRVDVVTRCWNWTSPNSLVGRGRGLVSVNGKLMLHHRAVWTLLRGEIPAGAFLCHHCDNPRCANPDHIYVGDGQTNADDMRKRRRHWAYQQPERAKAIGAQTGAGNDWARGTANPKAKLSIEQVDQIRAATGSSYAIAALFGVNASTVQRIKRGFSWNS